MKLIVWLVFTMVVVLWTGATVLVVQAIEWSAQQILLGSPAILATATGNIVIPIWMSPWLDPSVWATILQTVQGVLVNAATAVPFLSSVLGWLAPLVWVVWALGLLLLLAMAIAGTLLLQRFRSGERAMVGRP